jgi:hypothetical protein
MRLVKMTKRQVIAHVRTHGSWSGLVCASKMYPIIGRTAMYLDLEFNSSYDVCVKDETMLDTSTDEYNRIPRSFDHWYNNWSYYNTNHEEGYYAHFYLIR